MWLTLTATELSITLHDPDFSLTKPEEILSPETGL